MRALWLDFQRPEPGRQRTGVGLLLGGLLLAVALAADYLSVLQEIDATGYQVSRLRREAGLARQADGVDASSKLQQSFAAGADDAAAAGRTAAQWDALLASLERAADENMTLLALSSGSREIQISGEARNIGAAMDYVRRLQSSAVVSSPHLTQSEVVTEHPQRPVRFTLSAQWREG